MPLNADRVQCLPTRPDQRGVAVLHGGGAVVRLPSIWPQYGGNCSHDGTGHSNGHVFLAPKRGWLLLDPFHRFAPDGGDYLHHIKARQKPNAA
jgi:hypothetical protein